MWVKDKKLSEILASTFCERLRFIKKRRECQLVLKQGEIFFWGGDFVSCPKFKR